MLNFAVYGTVNMLLFYLSLVLVIQVSADSDHDLGRLREMITHNVINSSPYDSIPKVGNNSLPVLVIFQLVNILIAEPLVNAVSIQFILKINWRDYRLKWDDPSKPAYHIKEVTVPAKEIWTPNIQVLTPVGSPATYSSEVLNVCKDGKVSWTMQITARTNCDLATLATENMANCSIRVAPWRFPSQEVSLTCPLQDCILSEYFEGSKYKVLNATQIVNSVKYDCCPDKFDNAELMFSFERK